MTCETDSIMIELSLIRHQIPSKLPKDIRRIEKLCKRKTLLRALIALKQQEDQRGRNDIRRSKIAQGGYANAFESSDCAIHPRLVVPGYGMPQITQAEVKCMKAFGLTKSKIW